MLSEFPFRDYFYLNNHSIKNSMVLFASYFDNDFLVKTFFVVLWANDFRMLRLYILLITPLSRTFFLPERDLH